MLHPNSGCSNRAPTLRGITLNFMVSNPKLNCHRLVQRTTPNELF
ncbi:hypothetical protein [Burkholderia contaminans]|nr:hypothetical protein [Burkholderia contaminans]